MQAGTAHGHGCPVLVHGKAAREQRSCTSARGRIEDGRELNPGRENKHQTSSDPRELGEFPLGRSQLGCLPGRQQQHNVHCPAGDCQPDQGTHSVVLYSNSFSFCLLNTDTLLLPCHICFRLLSIPTIISHAKGFWLMQIKGKDFIPPTNLLWLAAVGLWGEIRPASESLAPPLCQRLCQTDLLLLRDAPLPGCDILLGGSAVGERDFGQGGSGWQMGAGTVLWAWGAQGWAQGWATALPLQKHRGAGGVWEARQGHSALEDKKLHPGAPARGAGTRGRAQSRSCTRGAVGWGLLHKQQMCQKQTNKRRVSRDKKNSWLQVKFSKYF